MSEVLRRRKMVETKEAANVLESLMETLEDGQRGFGAAAGRLARNGREDLASTMHRLSEQRGRMARELREATGSNGESSGSLTAALHRGWMAFRDALTGNDSYSVLAAAEDGEDHAVDEYRRAVGADLSEEVRGIVERQAAEVKTAHDKVKALRDSNA
jgi:uncharacterized protein (TIGR02284 family)